MKRREMSLVWACAVWVAALVALCAPATAANFPLSGDDAYQASRRLATSSWHTLFVNNEGIVLQGGMKEATLKTVPGLSSVVAVAAGGGTEYEPKCRAFGNSFAAPFSLALSADGKVWMWGDTTCGQTGNGVGGIIGDSVLRPQQVPGLENIVSIAAGCTHALAADSSGRVWAWGGNEYGQVRWHTPRSAGASGPWVERTPTVVYEDQNDRSPLRVHAGCRTSAMHRVSTGEIVVWGELSAATSFAAPAALPSSVLSAVASWQLKDSRVQTISLGHTQSYLLLNDGTMVGPYGTGSDVGTPINQDGTGVAVAAGRAVGMMLTRDGRVLIHGQSGRGSLGVPSFAWSNAANTREFLPVSLPGRAVAIAAGREEIPSRMSNGTLGFGSTQLVLLEDGSVYGWGGNLFSAVATGAGGVQAVPVRISGLPKVTDIFGFGDTSVALDEAGRVWSWGCSKFSNAGADPYASGDCGPARLLPALRGAAIPARTSVGFNNVGLADVAEMTQIADGGVQVARTSDGRVYAWDIESGGTAKPPGWFPINRPTLLSARNFKAISGQLLLDTEGSVFSIGLNTVGERGRGDINLSYAWAPSRLYEPSPGAQRSSEVVEFGTTGVGNGRERYFLSAHSASSASLDRLKATDGSYFWQRSGRGFRAWPDRASAPYDASEVYRFWCLFPDGKPNTHFYTANPVDRDLLTQLNPSNVAGQGCRYEGVDFYSVKPNYQATMLEGACAEGYQPVYRTFNNRVAQNDGNHRMSTSYIDYYRAIKFLGAADEGAVFCSPKSSVEGGDLQAYHTHPGVLVASGSELAASFVFANNGPGDAPGAVVQATISEQVTPIALTCSARLGAMCPQLSITDPTQLAQALRLGIAVPSLPAGGFLVYELRGRAPTVRGDTTAEVKFGATITPPAFRQGPAGGAMEGPVDQYLDNNTTYLSSTIVRDPIGCSTAPSVNKIELPAQSESQNAAYLGVYARAGCALRVRVDFGGTSAWMTASVPATASAAVDQNTVTLIYSTNSSSQAGRTATLYINDIPVRVTQRAAEFTNVGPCVRGLRPGTHSLAANSYATISTAVEVASADCAWRVKSDAAWVTTTLGAQGTGGGAIALSVQPNSSDWERIATIMVNDTPLTIRQAGKTNADVTNPTTDFRPGDGGGGGDGGEGGGSGGSGGEGGAPG